MQLHQYRFCDDHPSEQVNYVYQQELDSLKMGCFSCVTSENGTFFFNFKHFLHLVEELLKERIGFYKKGNNLYHEIEELLTQFQDKLNQERQYYIIEQIASFFEINEDNYKLQLATTNQTDQYSNASQQYISEQSDYEDSMQISQHSLKKDTLEEMDKSVSDIVCQERNLIEFSLRQTVKKLKNQAITTALEKCQDKKCHDYLPFLNWKQFKQYSQYYVNKEYKYYYHIYCENENDFDQENMQEDYEHKYNPTRADSSSSLSRSSLTSPSRQSFMIDLNSSSTTDSNSRKNSNQIHFDHKLQFQDEGRYFHECIECSLIYQQTQDQIDLINIMFSEIKQLIAFKTFITPLMTFNPIMIFWDLRIDL